MWRFLLTVFGFRADCSHLDDGPKPVRWRCESIVFISCEEHPHQFKIIRHPPFEPESWWNGKTFRAWEFATIYSTLDEAWHEYRTKIKGR